MTIFIVLFMNSYCITSDGNSYQITQSNFILALDYMRDRFPISFSNWTDPSVVAAWAMQLLPTPSLIAKPIDLETFIDILKDFLVDNSSIL